MRRFIALLTTLTATVAGAALAVAPAQAAGGLDVGLTAFKHFVVDQAHGHVFLTQGTDTVVVTDLAGAAQTPLTGLSGADGMTLSPDGSTLWVALSTGDALAAIDTTTLASTTYPTGTTTCPTSVAVAAGAVWFGKGCGTAGIDGLDPGTGVIHAGSTATSGTILAASGNELLATATGATTTLYAFTATGGTSAGLTEITHRATGGYAHDLAVSADGGTVVQASSSPAKLQAFSTGDLSPAGSYPTGSSPNAVALRSSDGLVAAGTTATSTTDVYLFHSGSTAIYRTYRLGRLKNAGLAFGASTLYAVSDVGGGALRLFVIDPATPTRTASTTRISTDHTTYAYGATAKVRVRLSARSTNRKVTVYKTVAGTRTKVRTASVPVGGTLTVPVKVTERTVFTARYAGDAVSGPSSARTTVKVHAKIVQLLLGAAARRGNHYVFAAGRTIGYVAQVYPNHRGECVYLASQYKVGGSFTAGATSPCQKLKSTSRVFVPLRTDASLKGVTLRFRGTFRGDARNLAATGPWLYVTFA